MSLFCFLFFFGGRASKWDWNKKVGKYGRNVLQKLLLQYLKFEFVCVAVAPGGLDGCFGFTVKLVVIETASKGSRGKRGSEGTKQKSACAFQKSGSTAAMQGVV